MRNLVKEAFSLHLLIMRVLGLIPFDNHKKLFRFHSLAIYLLFTIPLPLLTILYYFTVESVNVNKISESAFVSFELTTFIFKHLPFILYGSEISTLIHCLEKPIFSNNFKKRQEKILNHCNDICKKTLLFFLTCVSIAHPMFSSAPIFRHSGRTPMEIWTPTDNTIGHPMYIISYVYVVLVTMESCFITAAYDTLLAGLVYQLTCQIKILKDNLQNLDQDAELEIVQCFPQHMKNKALKNMIIYNKITQCVVHHQSILDFTANYEHYFSFGIFMQFLGSCLVICVAIFEITNIEPFSYTFFFIFFYTVTCLFQIFVYSIFGTTLFEESNTISTSIYMGNWYKYDIKSQKALLMIMERANRSVTVTAGSILDLSLDTFTKILKRAYSFYAVLTRYR